MAQLKVGAPAPQFSLKDQKGAIHRFSDEKGSWMLLYFYPKDDTPGCTKEACGIRDSFPKFTGNKIKVFGVSADTIESHRKFAEKFQLPFPLLADDKKEVVNAYGVWGEKQFMGKSYQGISRASFLIDPQGKIAKIYEKVKPEEHAQEVLNDVETLSSALRS